MLFSPSVKQHDDLRFARLIPQTVHTRGECGADRSAIFDGTDLDAFEVLLEPVVIKRQRTHEIRRAGEADQADAVIRARIDEL